MKRVITYCQSSLLTVALVFITTVSVMALLHAFTGSVDAFIAPMWLPA